MKVIVKNVESTQASAHQSMVASVFNVLSTSPSSELPLNECNDEIGDNTTTSDISGNVDTSTTKETNTNGIEVDTNTNGIAEVEVEAEILDQDQDNTNDCIDNLKSLSNLKK